MTSSAADAREYPRPDRDRSDRWLTPQRRRGDFELRGRPRDDHRARSRGRPRRRACAAPGWSAARTGAGSACRPRGARRASSSASARCTTAPRVLLDGVEVGEHAGGYESFELDVTDALATRRRGRADRRGRGARGQARDPARQAAVHPARRLRRRLVHPDVGHLAAASGSRRAAAPTWRASALRGDSLTGFDVSGVLAGDAPAGTWVTVAARRRDRRAWSWSPTTDGRVAGRLDVAGPAPVVARRPPPVHRRAHRRRRSGGPRAGDRRPAAHRGRRARSCCSTANGSTCAASSTRATGRAAA